MKKEVVERWKRGAETNAEGVRIEGMGRGVPLPNRLGGPGSVVISPQQGPGGATAENEFYAFCGR